MDWIALFFALELGLIPKLGYVVYTPDWEEMRVEQNVIAVTFEAEAVVMDHFFIGGSVRTDAFDLPNNMFFAPFESSYLFETGLRYGILDVGFRHLCVHPVVPFGDTFESSRFDALYNEFYVRIESVYR